MGRDNPGQKRLVDICRLLQVPDGYFYDETEQRRLEASVVSGHLVRFTQTAAIIGNAQSKILVLQAGGPKAPTWWREKLQEHLTKLHIDYTIVVCMSPKDITQEFFDRMDEALNALSPAVVDVHISEQPLPLDIDVIVVDGKHVFLSLNAGDIRDDRACSIYFEDEKVGEAIGDQLVMLAGRTQKYELAKNFFRTRRALFGRPTEGVDAPPPRQK